MSKFGSYMASLGMDAGSSLLSGFTGGMSGLIGSWFGADDRQVSLANRLAQVQYKWQQKAAEEDFRRNKEFWNMNNEYNAPSAVRSRLEDASINPAIAFGGGSGVTPAQMPSGSSSVGSLPSSEGSRQGDQLSLASASVLSDIRVKNAQAQLLTTQANKVSNTTPSKEIFNQMQRSIIDLNNAMVNKYKTSANLNSWQLEFNKLNELNWTTLNQGKIQELGTAVAKMSAEADKITQEFRNLAKQGKWIDPNNLFGLYSVISQTALARVRARLASKQIALTDSQIQHFNSLSGYLGALTTKTFFDTTTAAAKAKIATSEANFSDFDAWSKRIMKVVNFCVDTGLDVYTRGGTRVLKNLGGKPGSTSTTNPTGSFSSGPTGADTPLEEIFKYGPLSDFIPD